MARDATTPQSFPAVPSSPTSLPVVLVGCGAVSQQFYLPTLRTLAQLGEVNVVALADPSDAPRQILANAFRSAQAVRDLSEVRAPEGSLIVIATPPRFHAAQTQEAMQRGWHVLCEKPMAGSAAECDSMIEAGRTHQRLLAVGLYKRFFPSSAYLKTLFATQSLGPLRRFAISEGGPFKWPAATPSFFQRAQTPGGVLLDIGVHVLDLLLWWLGEPWKSRYYDDSMGGLETNARIELSYSGGAKGVVHLSRDWATANQYRFEFEKGIVSWKVNDANGLTIQLAGAPAALRSELTDPITLKLDEAVRSPQMTNPQSFIRQLRNIRGAIQNAEPLLVTGEEGARSLRFIERCYQKRSWLEHPWFTAAEADRARQLSALS